MKTIKFNGPNEIANISELFNSANSLWNGAWHDCPAKGENEKCYSFRTVLCNLEKEDAIRKYTVEDGIGAWERYSGPVMLTESVNGCSEKTPFLHRFNVCPIREETSGGHKSDIEYDFADEPDGRNPGYTVTMDWTRDSFAGQTVYNEARQAQLDAMKEYAEFVRGAGI